jgi:hypothetical protein
VTPIASAAQVVYSDDDDTNMGAGGGVYDDDEDAYRPQVGLFNLKHLYQMVNPFQGTVTIASYEPLDMTPISRAAEASMAQMAVDVGVSPTRVPTKTSYSATAPAKPAIFVRSDAVVKTLPSKASLSTTTVDEPKAMPAASALRLSGGKKLSALHNSHAGEKRKRDEGRMNDTRVKDSKQSDADSNSDSSEEDERQDEANKMKIVVMKKQKREPGKKEDFVS